MQFKGQEEVLSNRWMTVAVLALIVLGLFGIATASRRPVGLVQPVPSHAPSILSETEASGPENEANRIDQGTTSGAASVLTLRIVPEQVTLVGDEASQRLVVLETLGNGSERDVTSMSRFSAAHPNVATVSAIGKVTAGEAGKTILRAQFDGQSTEATVRVIEVQESAPISFRRDIVRILTKHGCNASDCHGSVKGRGGYKLSLNGLDPREDYEWTVKGGGYQVLTMEVAGKRIPRINLDEMEKSLLLTKPTLGVPHGGEQLFGIGSKESQTILSWIRQGAPYGEEQKRSTIASIEVFPYEVVLDQDAERQLLVTGYFADGRREDFTEQAHYVSNNTEVAEVTSDGLVYGVGGGETDIIIFAPGHFATVRLGVVTDRIENYPDIPSRNFIDDHVFAKLRKFEILPSAVSTDEEFLRRVCLDVAGTLPPPDRVSEFLASNDPRKRDKLIDALLNSPEYVDYWTFRFSDLFRVALYATFIAKNTHAYWDWIYDSMATNKPYDQIARERISAQGLMGPTSHYVPGEFLPEDNMAEQVRVFMGRRLDCAQCHNHPYQAWRQDQFWGLTAFFGGMARVGYLEGMLTDLPGGGFGKGGSTGPGRPIMHPRKNQPVQATFLDGAPLPEAHRSNPRKALAQWMTSHPYFAQASVNRMWSYFFGKGIVDPVDDFRATNPPSHPELLKALARYFREQRYDLKELVRVIVQSRTYGLSSNPNETNREDTVNYSHSIPRRLDAEVLLDAISTVTAIPEIFTRSSHGSGTDPPGTRAISLKESDVYASRFLDIHGRPDRLMVPERNNDPTLLQALHRLAGKTYIDKLSKAGGRVDALLKRGASNREIIEEFCVTALSRFPTTYEVAQLETLMNQSPDRRQAVEDLLWGLLNTSEFAYNH